MSPEWLEYPRNIPPAMEHLDGYNELGSQHGRRESETWYFLVCRRVRRIRELCCCGDIKVLLYFLMIVSRCVVNPRRSPSNVSMVFGRHSRRMVRSANTRAADRFQAEFGEPRTSKRKYASEVASLLLGSKASSSYFFTSSRETAGTIWMFLSTRSSNCSRTNL